MEKKEKKVSDKTEKSKTKEEREAESLEVQKRRAERRASIKAVLVDTYHCNTPLSEEMMVKLTQERNEPIAADVQVTITEADAIKWYEPKVMKTYTLVTHDENEKFLQTKHEVITLNMLAKGIKRDEKTGLSNILYDVRKYRFQECPSLNEYCVDFKCVKFWLKENA